MIDYKVETERIIKEAILAEPNPGEGHIIHIAAALAAAEKRGRVAGLREAARLVAYFGNTPERHDIEGLRGVEVLERRAEEVEKE